MLVESVQEGRKSKQIGLPYRVDLDAFLRGTHV